eukprot:21659-Prymnesium_polylepis.1
MTRSALDSCGNCRRIAELIPPEFHTMLDSAKQARESSTAQRAVGEAAAAGTGTHGAASSNDPSLQESLPVLPRVRPYWQALGELPAARVATFA